MSSRAERSPFYPSAATDDRSFHVGVVPLEALQSPGQRRTQHGVHLMRVEIVDDAHGSRRHGGHT
jgi:hypothetical protein